MTGRTAARPWSSSPWSCPSSCSSSSGSSTWVVRCTPTRCSRRAHARARGWPPPRPAGSARPAEPACSDAARSRSARPGAHVCPADVATLKANVVGAVNRMVAAVGAVTAVHISCNDGDAAIPSPPAPGPRLRRKRLSRRLRQPGRRVRAGRVGARRVRLPAVHPVHQLHPWLDEPERVGHDGDQLGDEVDAPRSILAARTGHRAVRARAVRAGAGRGGRRRRRLRLRPATRGPERGRLRGHGRDPHRGPEADQQPARGRHGRQRARRHPVGPRGQRRPAGQCAVR